MHAELRWIVFHTLPRRSPQPGDRGRYPARDSCKSTKQMNIDLGQLRLMRSQLTHEGRFVDAIPLQLQILEAVQLAGDTTAISNAWNYLSMLYYRAGYYAAAEHASRESIAVYRQESKPNDETIACYEMLLAQILAAQQRFDDAVVYGTEAVRHYSSFHDPPDDFLIQRQADVDRMVEYGNRKRENAG